MSFLLFLDESGTDQKQMPYEIHGGIIVPLWKTWDLIRTIKNAELRLFGDQLSRFGFEAKGERLLRKKTFKHAEGKNKKNPDEPPPTYESEEDRRQHALSFLRKGASQKKGESKQGPNAREFRAYGLACLELVDEVFQACHTHDVKIIAAAVDPGAPRPAAHEWEEMLRKDLVFLFERVFYFMEEQPAGSMAVTVFDQIDDLEGTRCTEGRGSTNAWSAISPEPTTARYGVHESSRNRSTRDQT